MKKLRIIYVFLHKNSYGDFKLRSENSRYESNAGYNGGKVESGLFIINAKPSLEIASAHLNNMSNLEINLLRILMFEAKSNILKIKKTKKIQNKIKSGFLFCFAF